MTAKQEVLGYRHQMGRTIWFVSVATLVCLPLILCLSFGAEFINLANESAAYRFFYAIRLHYGPDLTAWLPQGQLVTAIQQLITSLLPSLTGDNLRGSLNLFSLCTIGMVSVISVTAIFLAASSSAATWLDRLALSVVTLAPIYVFPGSLMWLWPDYLALNVALAALVVALFQWELHRYAASSIRCALYGALAGSIAANKISMIVLAVPLIAVAANHGTSLKAFFGRAGIAAITAIIAFAFWWLAVGLFRAEWSTAVAMKWWRFVMNPGAEPGFSVWEYLLTPYGLAALWFATALLTFTANMRRRAGAVIVISAGLSMIAVWKRPAGTTLSETALSLLVFGAMLFTMTKPSKLRFASAVGMAITFVAASVASRQPVIVYSVIAGSKPHGDEQWAFFNLVQRRAAGREIVYFLPNNHYQHGDVFLLLLKGAADFGTWSIGGSGAALLRRLGFDIAFVTEHDDASEPRPALSKRKVWVWINADRLRDVEEHFPELADAENAGRHEVIQLPRSAATGHIVDPR
jgi:hypothetical protein